MGVDVENAVPGSHLPPRFKRWLAILVGATAISAAGLAWMESDNSRKEQNAFVDASRSALDAFVKLGASGPRFQFEVNAVRQSTLLDARSTARAATASIETLPLQIALGQSIADNQASRRLLAVSRRLKDLPDSAPGLDEIASDSLRIRSEADIEPIYGAQDAALSDAERYGTRQQRAMYGLSLLAVAASLLGLAGLIGAGRSGRIALSTATGALTIALATGLSGFLV